MAISRFHASSWALISIVASIFAANSHCYQTTKIKIQVNHDSQQRPPYLIEAIRRANEAENLASSLVEEPSSPTDERSSDESEHFNENNDRSYSVIKEDAIESILDLRPESVLRLWPESLIDSVIAQGGSYPQPVQDMTGLLSAADQLAIAPPAVSSLQPPSASQQQLPVTSSHHKRPPIKLTDDDAAHNQESISNGQAAAVGQKLIKSQVSPSVSAESGGESEVVEKKVGHQVPQDTWEPSQVMAGVTNSSTVPATIKREYGSQVRTRVTLGGGYHRDKVQTSEDTGVSSSKLIASSSSTSSSSSSSSNTGASRIIEVPERIVLPASSGMTDDTNDRQPSAATLITTSNRQPTTTINKNAPQTTANATQFRGKPDSRCPNRGITTIEHPKACDKYFLCENGYIMEQTCPNGLLYGTRDLIKDHCVHRWQVVCGDKSIPNPISTPGCRWQYGIFMVQGSPRCTPDYYECAEGVYEVKKCSLGGQVYDDKTKTCQYAERVGCADEALGDFQCPPDDQANTYWPFPRYFLNDRALIHCVNDKPALVRCRDHERVDPVHLHCVPVKKRKQGDNTNENDNENGGETSESAAAAAAASQDLSSRRATRDESKLKKLSVDGN